jgi:hypothetical protein
MRAIWSSTLRTTAFALVAGALAVALGVTPAAPAATCGLLRVFP